MRFFDTHIHLSDFTDDTSKIVAEALACRTDKMINVSSIQQNWQRVVETCALYPENIVPAFGIHPWYVKEIRDDNLVTLEKLLKENGNAIIGECGLDGLKPDFEKQIEVFLYQTELAKKYNRPIIVHSVKSQNWFQNNWKKLPNKFVFHSYNGKIEFLKQVLNHGGYVGFNASIFKTITASEVLKYVPREKILLETDAPYQGLVRGEINKPEALPEIFYRIVNIRGEDKEDFASQIYENSEFFAK